MQSGSKETGRCNGMIVRSCEIRQFKFYFIMRCKNIQYLLKFDIWQTYIFDTKQNNSITTQRSQSNSS